MRAPREPGDGVNVNKLFKLPMALLALLTISLSVQGLTEAERAEIEARIKPVGEVCLQGDDSCGQMVTVVSAVSRSGEEIYNTYCLACHLTGVGGAPLLGDTVAWAERIAKGMDALYSTGINGMPGTTMMAKGGCMDCSDEEVMAAVDYMTENSQ